MTIKTNYVSALLVTTLGLCLVSCKGKQQEAQQQVPELSVITVGEENAELETGFPCTLEGENDVEIRPQIQGFLTKVYVEPGERVNKGQVLFQIDQVALKAQVDAAQAAINVAQANVNTARTNANNNKILFDKNIISQSAYQTSVDGLNAARAQLSQAQASLVAARKNLSYSTITAPVSGVVGNIDFKEGTLVSPQTLLTVLSNSDVMQANFSFTEQDILQMTDNGSIPLNTAIANLPEVSLLLSNGERYPIKGKVVSVSGVVDPSTGSGQAKAIFKNTPELSLRSGQSGQVLIPNMHPNSILIPQIATYEVQDMKFCYVLGDSSKAKSVPITVASQNDGKNYIVTGGLKPGDVVITEGVGITVKDGMVVKPKTASSAAATSVNK